jgi:hypothetical protein
MSGITDKIKEKAKEVKDKAAGTGEEVKDKAADVGGATSAYEEGAPGTEVGRKKDPLKEYDEKEPMTPAKIKEHEPTAVKRDSDQKIAESGQTGTSPEEAREKARKSGMTKGTAGAEETGSEYEQGAAGANK